MGFSFEGNADLDKSGQSIYLAYKSNFKNTSGIEFTNFYRSSSKDFWITRDSAAAPYINKPENYGTKLQFMGPSKDFFNYVLQVNREKEPNGDFQHWVLLLLIWLWLILLLEIILVSI